MFDRRAAPRVRQRRRVGIRLSSGEMVYTWTYDLSKGGLQIISEYSADKGDEFDIFFSVVDISSQTTVELEVHVRVVHVIYAGELNAYRIGLNFVRFVDDGKQTYERFIDARLHQLYKSSSLG